MQAAPPNPHQNDIVISWPELHRDTRILCHALMDRAPFKGIIAIARGGMIPAALVARELEIGCSIPFARRVMKNRPRRGRRTCARR